MDFELLVGIFPQVLIDGITLGFMYALIALGYTMVYGVLEFINFAHSEIFIVGAFVGVELLLGMKSAGWLDTLPWVLVLLLILVAGMAVSGVLAVIVERTAYRPLRHAPRLIPLISAIGVSFFLQDAIRLVESLWRNSFNLVYPTMDVLNERFELSSTIDVSVKSLVVTAAALLMLWGLYSLVNKTKIGKAIRAVAEDQSAASLMGIPTRASFPGSRLSPRPCWAASAISRAPCSAASCWGCSSPSPRRTCRSSPAGPSARSTRTSSPSPSSSSF